MASISEAHHDRGRFSKCDCQTAEIGGIGSGPEPSPSGSPKGVAAK